MKNDLYCEECLETLSITFEYIIDKTHSYTENEWLVDDAKTFDSSLKVKMLTQSNDRNNQTRSSLKQKKDWPGFYQIAWVHCFSFFYI